MSVIRTVRIVAAVVVLAFAAAPALAADAPPSARQVELANQVFAAMHMERTMEGVTRSMEPMMMKQFETLAPQMTQAQRQTITKATSDLTRKMTTKLMGEMAPIYAATFTEAELRDLLAFYRSPTGQSVIDKTPLVMSRMQPAMMEMMPGMMLKLRERLCAELACPAQD